MGRIFQNAHVNVSKLSSSRELDLRAWWSVRAPGCESWAPRVGDQWLSGERLQATLPSCISLTQLRFLLAILGRGFGVCPYVQHKTHSLRSGHSLWDQRPSLRRTGWSQSAQNSRITCPSAAFSL